MCVCVCVGVRVFLCVSDVGCVFVTTVSVSFLYLWDIKPWDIFKIQVVTNSPVKITCLHWILSHKKPAASYRASLPFI